MEEIIRTEEPPLEMGIEDIVDVLSSVSLVSVTVGDFLVIMRSEFDLTLSGEPYTGLEVLLNMKTGKYFSRIWNQTVDTGFVTDEDELLEACENHFGKGRPCLGCPEEQDKHVDAEFYISQTPIPRRIARKCLKFLGYESDASVSSCSECTKLSDTCLSGEYAGDVEELGSSSKLIKNQGNESSVSGEYNGKCVSEDIEKIVIKPEWLQSFKLEADEHQEGDSADFDEIDRNNESKIPDEKMARKNWWKFKCDSCDYKTLSENLYRRHMRSDEHKALAKVVTIKLRNNPLGASSKEVVKDNSTRNESKKYNCETCPYGSAKLSNLKQHVSTVHEKIRNHVCQECKYAASCKSNLKSHIESVHEKKKDSACKECGKAFTKKALKVHVQGVHLKIKNFFCGECGRAFLQKGDLKKHQKGHETGARFNRKKILPNIHPKSCKNSY